MPGLRELGLARQEMNYQADFVEGEVLFSEAKPRPPSLSHLQTAMFLDRPDLWKGKPRRSKPVPPEQQPLPEP